MPTRDNVSSKWYHICMNMRRNTRTIAPTNLTGTPVVGSIKSNICDCKDEEDGRMCMLLFVEKARQKCRAVRPRKVVVVRNILFWMSLHSASIIR